MEIIYQLLLFLQIICVQATLYYSQNNRSTYVEAEASCTSMNGTLLRYGQLFNFVVETCRQEQVAVWAGSPVYLKKSECYVETGRGNPVYYTTSYMHLAVCADLCSNSTYDYLGLKNTTCRCFTSYQIGFNQFSCVENVCPGNVNDRCGQNYFVVYSRVPALFYDYTRGTTICQYRKYENSTSGKNVDVDCTSINLTYICRVGDTDDIDCGFDNFSLYPEETTVSSSQIERKSSNTREVIGISVTVAIFTVIVIVIVVCFLRKRSEVEERADTSNVRHPDDLTHQSHEQSVQNSEDLNAQTYEQLVHHSEDGKAHLYEQLKTNPKDKPAQTYEQLLSVTEDTKAQTYEQLKTNAEDKTAFTYEQLISDCDQRRDQTYDHLVQKSDKMKAESNERVYSNFSRGENSANP